MFGPSWQRAAGEDACRGRRLAGTGEITMPPTEAQHSPQPRVPAAVLPLPIITMARFRRLMHYEGWDVDLARMCVDTAYAYACMATAHTSSDERLRSAALQLFDAYDRNAAVGTLH
jgi:hypothetical protein